MDLGFGEDDDDDGGDGRVVKYVLRPHRDPSPMVDQVFQALHLNLVRKPTTIVKFVKRGHEPSKPGWYIMSSSSTSSSSSSSASC